MSRTRKTAWVFAAGALLVIAALAWVSVDILELEDRERSAQSELLRQTHLGLALWPLETRLSTVIGPEAARPHYHYSSFYAPENARSPSNARARLKQGEVLVPSPLLETTPEYFRLYFEIDANGVVTSPQVPSQELEEEKLSANPTFAQVLSCQTQLVACQVVPELQKQAPAATLMVNTNPVAPPDPDPVQQLESQQTAVQDAVRNDYNSRWMANSASENFLQLQNRGVSELRVQQSTLKPFWQSLKDGDPLELFLLRRVVVNEREIVQGIWVDWPKLRSWLLDGVKEILPKAELVPVIDPKVASSERLLAALPLELRTSWQPEFPSAGSSIRTTLVLTWVAVLAALAIVGWMLHASVDLGERRGRFVSAVTHELRTPLTTFRMYSQMLADGMVTEESARADYLSTLKSESERLSRVVESVLLYARLEEGRGGAHRERVSASDLVDRILAPLSERASQGSMELCVDIDGVGNSDLIVDAQAVEQILLNLVDNSCKYASESHDRRIHLVARSEASELRLRVFDHGPGIPAGEEVHIFDPFHRSALHATGTIPGVGLGLALARGLARGLGGDLVLSKVAGQGATFDFSLKTA